VSWVVAGQKLESRLMLGTAHYPSPQVLADAVARSGAGVVTASLRRETAGGATGDSFFSLVRGLGVRVLPNTAGCRTAREAVTVAEMARELFATDWVKLEVIGDDYTLQPDPFGLVEAADELMKRGFRVFPYTTDDLVLAERLCRAGCSILMPWAAPIGSGLGLSDVHALRTLRSRLPDVTLIVDAGLGAPSHAAHAMELGFDGVLLNTAIAKARDPALMAEAFARAVEAGRAAHEAGLVPPRDTAAPSTPVVGTPFWHERGPA
jgi:thiazole synthase